MVLGAFNPVTLYCPELLLLCELIVIGEVAVNVISFEANPTDLVVSIKVPDTL